MRRVITDIDGVGPAVGADSLPPTVTLMNCSRTREFVTAVFMNRMDAGRTA